MIVKLVKKDLIKINLTFKIEKTNLIDIKSDKRQIWTIR